MAEFPAMPWWTDAYLADTTHLTTIEHGAYMLLLAAMWRTGEARLPADDERLARIVKLGRRQWQRIRPTIMEFFREENGFVIQRRLKDEWIAVKRRSQQAANAADAKWLKHKKGRHADASPEQSVRNATTTTTITSKEERKKDSALTGGSSKTLIPKDWAPSADHYELAKKLELSTEEVGEAAAEMRAWSLGNGERRRDWDMVFSNWLRRNAKRKGANGYRGQRPLQDDSRSLTRAADRLIEANKRGEFSFGPRPGSPEHERLLAGESENVVRLLPKG